MPFLLLLPTVHQLVGVGSQLPSLIRISRVTELTLHLLCFSSWPFHLYCRLVHTQVCAIVAVGAGT